MNNSSVPKNYYLVENLFRTAALSFILSSIAASGSWIWYMLVFISAGSAAATLALIAVHKDKASLRKTFSSDVRGIVFNAEVFFAGAVCNYASNDRAASLIWAILGVCMICRAFHVSRKA